MTSRRISIFALISSGILWGATVPLSKVALGWLDPAWLTFGRFFIAALVLAVITRRQLRSALSWPVLGAGALGFGACVALQNAGIARTSVSHASVLMGIVPVLVALTSLAFGHGHATRREWLSFALSLAGIGLVAGGGGGGAHLNGDLLVVGSVAISAVLIALQPRLLAGRDPAALTAIEFFGAAGFALPLALGGPLPSPPASAGPVIAFAALALAGTVLPFWLFAFGQARVRPQLAGAFVNLEPVVGAGIGWVLFANPVGPAEILGALAVVASIAIAATVRTLPVRWPELAAAAWRSGIELQELILASTWDQPGDPDWRDQREHLRWRQRDGRIELDGRFLPEAADPALPALDERTI